MPRPILLAALILFVSCGTPVTPGAGSTPAQSATPIPTRPAPQLASPVATPIPATQPPATPVPATPTQASYEPMLTLTYGSASRSTNAFSTSWEVEPGKRIYGDGWPMLRQMEALEILVGATILFTASGVAQPKSGSAQIYTGSKTIASKAAHSLGPDRCASPDKEQHSMLSSTLASTC